ncbi:MAG TPA: hypothetical protein VF456_20470 [Vicinamibacterales bacterium]
MQTEMHAGFGTFLDDLPKALYVTAHAAFFGIGLWLWAAGNRSAAPHPGALLLYVASQVVFFAYFTKWITFKMAVLVEQMLMFAMVLVIAVGPV